MKTVFYDLETTGTDFAKSAVVQIGAIMDVDGEEVDNINLKIRHTRGANIDREPRHIGG
jgi:DNA polymerase III epsilon subunit-like protein